MFTCLSLFVVCLVSVLAEYPDCEHPETGKIVQNGAVFKQSKFPCIEFTCKKGGYEPTTLECTDDSTGTHECVSKGQSITKNCVTKVCTVNDLTVGFAFASIQCQGDNGVCYNPGDTFTKTHNGDVWDRTTCTINGNTVNYMFRKL